MFGASGAVGTSAVQLARHLGAEVTGVCSSANAELTTSLGASTVIDDTSEDLTERAERYDLILDAVGKRRSAVPLRRCRQALAPGGACVSVDDGSPKLRREDLVLLCELATKDEVRPVIDRAYPLDDIVDAHRDVDTGHKRGNVVITVPQRPQVPIERRHRADGRKVESTRESRGRGPCPIRSMKYRQADPHPEGSR